MSAHYFIFINTAFEEHRDTKYSSVTLDAHLVVSKLKEILCPHVARNKQVNIT